MRISTIHSFCRFLISKYEDIPYNYLSRYGERSLFVSKHQKDLGFYGPYNILGTDLPNVLKKYDHYFSFGIKTDEFADYLIKKNPNIIVDETIKNKKIDIFRIEKR